MLLLSIVFSAPQHVNIKCFLDSTDMPMQQRTALVPLLRRSLQRQRRAP